MHYPSVCARGKRRLFTGMHFMYTWKPLIHIYISLLRTVYTYICCVLLYAAHIGHGNILHPNARAVSQGVPRYIYIHTFESYGDFQSRSSSFLHTWKLSEHSNLLIHLKTPLLCAGIFLSLSLSQIYFLCLFYI